MTGVSIGYEGKGIFYAFAAGNGHRLMGAIPTWTSSRTTTR